jgi:hypothetical protein
VLVQTDDAAGEVVVLEHGPAKQREPFSQLKPAGAVGDRDDADLRALEQDK